MLIQKLHGIVNGPIETKRTVIREYSLKDTENYYDYAKNEEVCFYLGRKPVKTVSEAEKQVRQRMESENIVFLAVAEKYEDKFIGSISLSRDTRMMDEECIEIGFSLAREYWGKGIMSEALLGVIEKMFTKYDVKLISAYRYPENVCCGEFLDKLNFVNLGEFDSDRIKSDEGFPKEIGYILDYEIFNKMFHVEH